MNFPFLAAVRRTVRERSVDRPNGTELFYRTVRETLRTLGSEKALDFGAGSGSFWHHSPEQRPLRDLRPIAEIWAADFDPIVLTHPCSDRQVVLEPGKLLSFADGQFDAIVSDMTFEHIDDPAETAAELLRILRPGGVICARTANKWGYPALAAQLAPNRLHRSILKMVQPTRPFNDIFPTRYRLNRPRAVRCYFVDCEVSYYFDSAEPSYFFGSRMLYRTFEWLHRNLPEPLATSLCLFIRKRT